MRADSEPAGEDSKYQVLRHLLNLQQTDALAVNKPASYPVRPNRYSFLGWNRNSQDCYTERDIQLLNKIKDEFEVLAKGNKEKAAKFFGTTVAKQWFDLWQCVRPIQNRDDAFTLPNREAKDTVNYPLWTDADNMARKIANWQGERVKGQNSQLLNDPVMLVFHLLREEFFNEITMTECKNQNIEHLARLQSFVKNLVYWAPNYGPDRLHLHEIQSSLQEAIKTLANCVANMELPQLLTDTITNGKSLETIIGTYLHFLVDQPVADNFSTEYFEGNKCNSNASPVCKLFEAARANEHAGLDEYKQFNKFYNPVKVNENHLKMQLRSHMMDGIRLPKSIDKAKYLEAIATLDSLMNVRKTIENFRSIQSRLGNYVFALKFVDDANTLAANYIKLINKSRELLDGLIKSADQGLKEILSGPVQNKKHNYFEKNLQSLETCAAKDTKPDAQLKAYCKNAAESMEKYQAEMKSLVTSIQSGEASRELDMAMSSLSRQMSELNRVLPALIDNQEISIENPDGVCLPSDVKVESRPEKSPPPTNKIFSYGAWDEGVKHDPVKDKPIYTYRLYDDANKEIGSVEFYGQPMLCVSADHKQHNIVKTTGILSDLEIKEDTPISNICEVLPPSLFERVFFSAKSGALYGLFSGGSNVIGYTLKSAGVSDRIAAAIRNLTYYGCIFSMSFYTYYQQMNQYEETCDVLNAMYYAAFDTGKLWIINSVAGFIGSLLEKAGVKCDDNSWLRYLATGLNYAARYGFFAYQAVNNGVIETAAATATAIAVEASIEHGARMLVR